jgi:thioredoxin 1
LHAPTVTLYLLSPAVLQAVAQECGISAMPTFQVFQNGAKVDEMVGAQKDKLAALVEKWAKA